MLTETLSCQRGGGGPCVFLSARPALRCAGTQSVWQAAPSWEGGSFRTETQESLVQRSQEIWKSSAGMTRSKRSLSVWWPPQWQHSFSWRWPCSIFPWKTHWSVTLSGYKDGLKCGHRWVNFVTELKLTWINAINLGSTRGKVGYRRFQEVYHSSSFLGLNFV